MILPILKKYKAKQYTSFFVDYGWGGGGNSPSYYLSCSLKCKKIGEKRLTKKELNVHYGST